MNNAIRVLVRGSRKKFRVYDSSTGRCAILNSPKSVSLWCIGHDINNLYIIDLRTKTNIDVSKCKTNSDIFNMLKNRR